MAENGNPETLEIGGMGSENGGERSGPHSLGTGTPGPSSGPGEVANPTFDPDTGGTDPKTFDAAYVKGLREEAAANRVARASAEERAEAAIDRLFKAALNISAGDVLRDPSDLPDDPGRYLGEDGLPDQGKIRAAAEELAAAKPHLARPRQPTGQLQGPVGEQPTQVGLGAILRDAAR